MTAAFIISATPLVTWPVGPSRSHTMLHADASIADNFRLCVTKDTDNAVPFPTPARHS